MHMVRVWAELTDEMFESYEAEARRQRVPVETLVQHTVNCLLKELDTEEHDGPCYVPPS